LDFSRILIRATNWVGDAVMCVPALNVIRERFPSAHIAILAKPWVADLYRRESFVDEVILYNSDSRWKMARDLRAHQFDCAILLQNAFEAALIAWVARIPNRIGYNRDGRGVLLTRAIEVPQPGDIPRHERFYYLELLRRAGIIDQLPDSPAIHLTRPFQNRDRRPEASSIGDLVRGQAEGFRVPIAKGACLTRTIGISPGAAYGTAKQWLPERFAEAAGKLAIARGASIALFGSKSERALCDQIAAMLTGHNVTNHAGQTTLAQFIELAGQCELFLTNDSGGMHIASALGVPTVAIFGATDDIATGPTGSHARVVRQPVECSPCLLRECPIDHRCMTRVSADRVVQEALSVLLD
jgi:heptosyltransferase II